MQEKTLYKPVDSCNLLVPFVTFDCTSAQKIEFIKSCFEDYVDMRHFDE